MDFSAVCPACHETLVDGTAATMPTVCPKCGVRVMCPGCGSRLERRTNDTDTLFCTHCGAAARPDATVTDEVGTVPAKLPSLPGFEVEGELGRGGMGIVYKARELHLNREVALKVLPPALAGSEHLLQRFRNEANVASNLINANILPVFQLLDMQGAPVLVMPLVRGSDLGRILRDRAALRAGREVGRMHAWARLDDRQYFEQVLPVLDLVVSAVAALHREGVLHRDIKPSNVLIDEWGKPWLSDFGLARLEEEGAGTVTGQGMGTPGYMSPEQSAGAKDLDYRADLFGLGATLYQALTLELPYGKGRVKEHGPAPVAPSRRQPLLARDFDTVLLKSLERNRNDRYGSAIELQEDWQRVRQGQLPRARRAGKVQRLIRVARRHPLQSAFGLAALTLIGLLGTLAAMWRNQEKPSTPEPVVEPVYRTVRVETEPPGARIVIVPLHPLTGEHLTKHLRRPEAKSPVTVEQVAVGRCLVIADLGEGRFHEVYRLLPAVGEQTVGKGAHERAMVDREGTVHWPAVAIPDRNIVRGMAYFGGGDFVMGAAEFTEAPPHNRTVKPFYLDTTEVTEEAYQAKFPGAEPKSVRRGKDFPVVHLPLKAALSYAEAVGKRLPDEAEYEFAATAGGKRAFPWGDDKGKMQEWPLGRVREPAFDHTDTDPPVYGLLSNVLEWTETKYAPYPSLARGPQAIATNPALRDVVEFGWIIRGGPYAIASGRKDPTEHPRQWSPRFRPATDSRDGLPGLGFRCARSAAPRY